MRQSGSCRSPFMVDLPKQSEQAADWYQGAGRLLALWLDGKEDLVIKKLLLLPEREEMVFKTALLVDGFAQMGERKWVVKLCLATLSP